MGGQESYQELVASALSGSSQAFDELVRRFEGMALAVSRRRLNDSHLAEDAVQEAFLIAYLKLSELKEVQAFPAWFRKILRTCCNRIDKRERMSRAGDPEALQHMVDPFPGPHELLVRYQSRAMVAKTLAQLDGPLREACIQRYLYGREYQDIAGELGLPVGTVKRRLHDARNKLIKSFETETEPVLRVGYMPVSDHLVGMVSHHLNQGRLKIQIKKFLSWASLTSALLNETLDAAFIMAPLALALRNQGVPIVYAMDAHHDGSALTVQNGLLGRQRSLDARVGIPHTISTHSMLLKGALGLDGMELSPEVTPTYRGPSYLLKSLATRQISAFFCAEPWNTKAVVEGVGKIMTRSRDLLPGHICCILVVREDYLKKNTEMTMDYLKLIAACTQFIEADHRRSAKIQERYTGVSADIVQSVLKSGYITYHDLKPDRGRIEAVMNLALRAGLIDRPCDLDRFMITDTP